MHGSARGLQRRLLEGGPVRLEVFDSASGKAGGGSNGRGGEREYGSVNVVYLGVEEGGEGYCERADRKRKSWISSSSSVDGSLGGGGGGMTSSSRSASSSIFFSRIVKLKFRKLVL